MGKVKTAYFCQNCGAQSPQWIGKCPSCGEWNTFVEEVIKREEPAGTITETPLSRRPDHPQSITAITWDETDRMNTCDQEFNRVLGGGLVPGSLVLIGGEPGIGKSTLMLQVGLKMKDKKVLYITGEESSQQIRSRAQRLGMDNTECYVLNETSLTEIFKHIGAVVPDLVIIDSIQTLHTDIIDSSAGSVSQIRECALELQQFAKASGRPVILIGHVNKEGLLAGPKILEHMVDTVLQFEGDQNYMFRILRAIKNRYGSTSELGIYEMHDDGLREVHDPSEILISHRDEALSGIAIAATIEGVRPMLIEIQALVSTAAYGTPQRATTGFDQRRLNMLLAVLEKKSGFRLGIKDVFLNIAGGIQVDDPAIDLAVIISILSSNADKPVGQKICFAGEIGLSGEVRAVNRIELRISEAEKLGYKKILVSKYNLKGFDKKKYTIDIIPCSRIEDAVREVFTSQSRDQE